MEDRIDAAVDTTPEHFILQQVACHGRLNAGNLESELSRVADMLHTNGMLFILNDKLQENKWLFLTVSGKERLLKLNQALRPASVLTGPRGPEYKSLIENQVIEST